MLSRMPSAGDWPELRVADWRQTYATLLLYSQIVGKIRLALAPKMNQWWNVTLYVTARGLTTSPMPYAGRLLSIDFDFIDHRLIIQDSEGNVRALALEARPVCLFHADVMAALGEISHAVHISPQPQECPVTTPFSEDREHAHYDRAAVGRFDEGELLFDSGDPEDPLHVGGSPDQGQVDSGPGCPFVGLQDAAQTAGIQERQGGKVEADAGRLEGLGLAESVEVGGFGDHVEVPGQSQADRPRVRLQDHLDAEPRHRAPGALSQDEPTVATMNGIALREQAGSCRS